MFNEFQAELPHYGLAPVAITESQFMRLLAFGYCVDDILANLLAGALMLEDY